MRLSRRFYCRLAALSASFESYLSSSAFNLLFKLVYVLAVALMTLWGFFSEFHYAPNPPAMRPYIALARAAGYSLNLNTALIILLPARLFLTVLRETPILSALLPLDLAFPSLHIIVGYAIAAALAIHVPFHLIWISRWRAWSWGLFSINMSVITGFAVLITFLVLLSFALPRVRAVHFRLFRLVHVCCATLFFPLLFLHGMYRERPETYKWVLLPLLIYLFDKAWQRLRAITACVDLYYSMSTGSQSSFLRKGKILELRFPRAFKFRAGQYAEVRVPEINREWHCFTIASAPQEDTMCFYIKIVGDWTSDLSEAFRKREDGREQAPLHVHVRGPYGAPCQHPGDCSKVVLISGGVGSTPFASICKDLQFRRLQELAERKVSAMEQHDGEIGESLHTGSQQDPQVCVYEEGRVCRAVSTRYNIQLDDWVGNEILSKQNRSVWKSQSSELHPSCYDNFNSPTPPKPVYLEDGPYRAVNIPLVGSSSATSCTRSSYDVSWSTLKHLAGPTCQTKLENKSLRPGICTAPSTLGEKVGCHAQLSSRDAQRIPLFATSQGIEKNGVLIFCRTAQVNFVLLTLLLARIFILCVASILKSDYVRITGSVSVIKTGQWVAAADCTISILLAVSLTTILIMHLYYEKWSYFRSRREWAECILVFPLMISFASVNVMTAISNKPPSRSILVVQFLLFIPALFFMLAIRMSSSVAGRNLSSGLMPRKEQKQVIPDVDFIWTSPYDEDDEWLRQELEPLSKGSDLRLHRFLTREKDLVDVESGTDFISTTKTGRPRWGDLFRGIVLSAANRSIVGVFFCGPEKMQDEVKKAMGEAEMYSNLRASYLHAPATDLLMNELFMTEKQITALKERGCGVRLMFRHENFG